jgi:uncharacterized protein (DUF2252 family)
MDIIPLPAVNLWQAILLPYTASDQIFMIIQGKATPEQDRKKAFFNHAQDRANGHEIFPPYLLPKEERRQYIRKTLREDHQYRIHNKPEGAQAKFEKLARSPFTFFRGSALLFYRDHCGSDGHLPKVFTIGDVHPENFGVMPNKNGAPFFGVNDFDEAYIAPFSYDVKRGVLGFYLVSLEAGRKKKHCKKAAKSFVKGYLKGLKEFARDDREKWHEYRIDNSPKMIKKLLKESQTSREKWLAEIVDLKNCSFIPGEEIVPMSNEKEAFQKVIDKYLQDNEGLVDSNRENKDFFRVLDVAVKKGSGTASLGMDRFFILIDGNNSDDPGTCVILELKETRESALTGLVPGEKKKTGKTESKKIVQAHEVHLAAGDPYYGQATYDGRDFLVRERSPYKDEIDVDDLNKKEMNEYAEICGKTLAQTHARSDEDTGIMKGNAEEQILSSIVERLFIRDMVAFAKVSCRRLLKDYELFKKDYNLGAFNFVGKL